MLFALSGLPNATSQIGASSTVQQICPPDLIGRMSGVLSAAGAIGAAVGTIGVGLLIDHVHVIGLFNVQAGLYFACGIGTWLPVVRRVEPLALAD